MCLTRGCNVGRTQSGCNLQLTYDIVKDGWERIKGVVVEK